MDKGHMKRQKQGIRSTKEKKMTALSMIETAQDIKPPMEKETQNQIFVYHAVLEPKAGKSTSTTQATYPSAPWKAT